MSVSSIRRPGSYRIVCCPNCPISSSQMKCLNVFKKFFFSLEAFLEMMTIMHVGSQLSKSEKINEDFLFSIPTFALPVALLNTVIATAAIWECPSTEAGSSSIDEETQREDALKIQKFCNPLQLSNELIVQTSLVALVVLSFKYNPSVFSENKGFLIFVITCNLLKVVDISRRIWCASCCVASQEAGYARIP